MGTAAKHDKVAEGGVGENTAQPVACSQSQASEPSAPTLHALVAQNFFSQLHRTFISQATSRFSSCRQLSKIA